MSSPWKDLGDLAAVEDRLAAEKAEVRRRAFMFDSCGMVDRSHRFKHASNVICSVIGWSVKSWRFKMNRLAPKLIWFAVAERSKPSPLSLNLRRPNSKCAR